MASSRALAASRLPYPRSFLGLLLAGFTLVLLPLVGALAYSAWSTERLAEQSRDAVVSASQAARGSRSLVNRTASIERLAQQMVVLRDRTVAEDYLRVRESFRQVAGELLLLRLEAPQLNALKRTMAQEQSLYELVTGGSGRLRMADVRQRTGALAEQAHQVLTLSNQVAEREVRRLRASAEAVQNRIALLVLASTAAALLIALGLTRYIARPIAQLDRAIRQLGGADFSRPVSVSGPQDLRSLGERLDWLRRRLIEHEREKNRLLRHLSHELKTPLTAVREGAELLRDEVGGPLTAAQSQVVTIMRDNSLKLQRLIEALLDYQRALHAAASLVPRPVLLDAIVGEAVRSHELAIQAKGQRLVLELESVPVEGDAEKLRSIVDNLLGNAVKFSPPGGTIVVRASERDGEAVIDVIDSGPGVPLEEREAIFSSFYRGRARQGGRVQGTGLGLAIAREFAEAHGGRIAVVPEEAGGHFRVTLPRRAERERALA